jgi:hypothetical protein
MTPVNAHLIMQVQSYKIVCVYIKGAFVGVMNEQFDSIIDI